MALDFRQDTTDHVTPPGRIADLLVSPGFGKVFTDHMATASWSAAEGWHDASIRPYAPLTFDPATQIFHYGQSIFEGFKAYHQPDGGISTFRPEDNGARFGRSARRLALPELPVEDFLTAADLLIRTDSAWVPTDGAASLYLRPFMLATEVGLGVRPASEVLFLVIASPAGAYFAAGSAAVSIWVSEDYTRAAPGGTGAAKCGGNYAASLLAQQEALDNGCEQVVFLDAIEGRWLEELGGMNLWVVMDNGTLVTPELSGSILAGVTRDAVATLARDAGHEVETRRIDIDEVRKGVESGQITEFFACGTAAVISSVGTLKWRGGDVMLPAATPVATAIRDALLGIQHGTRPDDHGWMHSVC